MRPAGCYRRFRYDQHTVRSRPQHPDADGPPPGGLLDRAEELRALEDLIADVTSGGGHAVMVEGSAGTGKTTLLQHAGASAAAAGVRVLAATGHDLERGFPWGLALQLYGPVVPADPEAGVWEGAAGRVRPLLLGGATPAEGSSEPFPLIHAFYWLTANLADAGPTLLVVDDVQWGDAQTLQLLCYLLARLGGLSLGLLTAVRTGEPIDPACDRLLIHLAAGSHVHRLGPLSATDTARLTRRLLPDATERFCRAVAVAVAGNPFMCREIVAAVRSEQLSPDDEGAQRLGQLRPSGIHTATLVRLGQLGPGAAEVAAAVAVLGTSATPDLVGDLTDLDDEERARLLDALGAASVLRPGSRLAFVHPVVQEVVIDDLGAARRRQLHLRVAQALHARGAAPEEVATHLLRGDRLDEPWVHRTLDVAARSAMSRGAPARAAQVLQAALEATGGEVARATLQVRLARALVAAGDPGAMPLLQGVLDARAELVHEPAVAADLAGALYATGAYGDAATAFAHGVALCARQDDDALDLLDARLRAGADMAGMLAGLPPHHVGDRLTALQDPVRRATPAGRLLLVCGAGQYALGTADTPGDGPRTRDLVMGMLEEAMAPPGLPPGLGPQVGELLALSMVLAEEWGQALAVVDRIIAEATDRGEATIFASLLPLRALCQLHLGRLADAVADAEDALRLNEEVPTASPPPTAAARRTLAVAALLRGEPDVAAKAVDVSREDAVWAGSPLRGWFLDAMGRVHLADGEAEQALTAFLAAGTAFQEAGGPGAMCDWPLGAAEALRRLDRAAEGLELVDRELARARRFGAPRAVAAALRARAALLGPAEEEVLDLLEEADVLLEGSAAVLERAEVAVARGAALRRAGLRRQAREHLRVGLDLARSCGARVLVDRAAEELEAAGARRPQMAVSGVDALTPSELRVVRLAADGHTNRAIAETLFVTRKTVESHLSNAYRKLGISTRSELTTALRG